MKISNAKDKVFEEYQKVKDGTPDQWVLYFEDFIDGGRYDFFWKKKKYKHLLDWVQAPVSKFGLGLDLDRFQHMLTFNPDYRHKWKPIVAKYLMDRVEAVNELGYNERDGCDKTKNITPTDRGTSFTYRIAKLKRDFGESEVMQAIEENSYTKASQVERHFGVGKPLLSPVEKLVRAYSRLSDQEKKEFASLIH